MKRLNNLSLVCAAAVAVIASLKPDLVSGQNRRYLQLPAIKTASHPPPATDPLPTQIAALPDVDAQMKVIQRRSQLLIARSNIVRTAVADPSIIDIVQYSPSEMSIIGLELGTTTVTLWFENSPEPLIYLVETIRDPSIEERQRLDYGRLEKKLSELFPNSKVYLIPLSGKIVVKGQARDGEEAARILSIVRGEVINQNGQLGGPQPPLAPGAYGAGGFGAYADPTTSYNVGDLASNFIVNMLEIPGEYQVMLRVRIAELKRSMLKRLGVNFELLINDGRQFFSQVLAGTPATLTGIFSAGDVSVLINALESNGTAKILAEPNITVLSGHPASFLSGGEFAVPTIVGIQGVGGQQTTFRGFGVSLVVVPTVLDRDLIRMQILPEFSAINAANSVNGIPGVNTRRVQTTVELREGQTIALAGLLSHQSETEVSGLPFLGQIPILGPLMWKGKRATMDETELLILVTPELVRPMEPDEVPPVPGHEVTWPNNHELYLHGMTEGAPDQNNYQLAPYGNGSGQGIPVGFSNYNPAPASPGYSPVPTNPFGGGQTPLTNGSLPPDGGPRGRYPIAPPPRRPTSVPDPAAPPPAASQNVLPGGRPIPIGPSAGRYAGHATSPSLERRQPVNRGYTIQAGYDSERWQPDRSNGR